MKHRPEAILSSLAPSIFPRRFRRRPGWLGRTCLALGGAVAAAVPLAGQPVASSGIADLDITQLLTRSVTYEQSPAAISTLGGGDARRPPGTNLIPDLLRQFPGIEVSQDNPHRWTIDIRGFGDESAKNALMLIDGRPIAGTALGGIHWDNQEIFIEDLERVEVKRGSGPTLWDDVPIAGAGGINGVVNLISSNSRDTQGTVVKVRYTDRGEETAGIRYGGRLSPVLTYRVYGQSLRNGPFVKDDGTNADDVRTAAQGGLRLDWQPVLTDQFTLQGGYHAGTYHDDAVAPALVPPFSAARPEASRDSGASVQGRWTHDFPSVSQFFLQASYDRAVDATPAQKESLDSYHLDLQFHQALARHDLIAALGYGLTRGGLTSSPGFSLQPQRHAEDLPTAYLQDTIDLPGKSLHLTVHAKVEDTPSTGVELQPGAHLLWQLNEHQSLWGGVGRALRSPSWVELDGRATTGVEAPSTLLVDQGNPGLKPEELVAYELGYRLVPSRFFRFELSGYYNVYDRLIVYQPGAATFLETDPPPAHTVQPSLAENGAAGSVYGAEASLRYSVAPWRVIVAYAQSVTHYTGGITNDSPRHLAFVRTNLTLNPKWEAESVASYFSRTPAVAGYLRWDLGVIWRPLGPTWELSVMAQNLLSPRHRELDQDAAFQVPRTFAAKALWRF